MEAYPEFDLVKSPALRHLMAFLQHRHDAWAESLPDLETFERELHTQVLALERELLADELSRYDVDAPAVRVQGQVCSQVAIAPETYLTSAGPVTVARHVYRPSGHNTRHVCPLELRSGIVAGFFTPSAARQAAYVVAQLPPATSAKLLVELGNLQPSASSLERLPKHLSARWEAHRAEWEAQLRTLASVPGAAMTLAVSLDGVLAPMRQPAAVETDALAENKQPKGPKGYQEVGCGAVSLYDADGERLHTVR
jgi:hypothetical protein